MKKIITSSALIIGLLFITGNARAQTAVAVKPTAVVAPAAIKDTAHAVTKTAIKKAMPDPVAAVANQGKEVIPPIVITVVKLPAIADQKGETKQ